MNEETRQPAPPTRHALQRFSSSGWLTPVLVGLLCVGLVVATVEAGRGHLHKVTDAISAPVVPPAPAGPGGQSVLQLTRVTSASAQQPEFASVTLLPGRGMNVFQITARLPGRGEVSLLDSPTLAGAETLLTGQGPDANGAESTSLGGAILVPWARRLTGTPVAGSAVPMLESRWAAGGGAMLRFPPESPSSSRSTQGWMLLRASEGVRTMPLADGQAAVGTYRVGGAGAWPGPLEVTVTAELHAQALELTVRAKNTGTVAAPLGIGWQPHFAPPSGDRSDAVLSVPSTTVVEVDRAAELPTGRVNPVTESALDFSRATGTGFGPGAVIGSGPLDETYLNLKTAAGAAGPAATLTDPAAGVRLELMALSGNISNFHVQAPENDTWVSIAPNTNVDDPLGPEWHGASPGGLLTVAPGATVEWKVRLTISGLSSGGGHP